MQVEEANGNSITPGFIERVVDALEWVGQVVDDAVEQVLHAFVLECRAHEHRRERALQSRSPDCGLKVLR